MSSDQSAWPSSRRLSSSGITAASATKSQTSHGRAIGRRSAADAQRKPTSSSHDWNARFGTSTEPMKWKSIAWSTGTNNG